MTHQVADTERAIGVRSDSVAELGERHLRWTMWLVAGLLGFAQVWALRHTVDADGVSYIDMGDAFFRGDWSTFINGYWSPLYPVLLGFVRTIFDPTPYLEYTVAHLLNFAIYVCVLLSFDFFLRQLIRCHDLMADGDRHARFPRSFWLVLGYVLFVWSTLTMIGLQTVTPDLCVAGLVYLSIGVLLRIRMDLQVGPAFLLLGLILGVAYLAKVAMLPFAVVVFLVSWVAARDRRHAARRVLGGAVIFAIVATPWVVALSSAKGRFTFGDSGRLNYTWGVRDVREIPMTDGGSLERTRRLQAAPAVYEFGNPVGGTYPVWYDPSHWQEGVRLRVNVEQQIRLLWSNARIYLRTLFDVNGVFVTTLILLACVGRRRWHCARDVLDYWFVLAPAVAMLGMYAIVFTYSRYLGPFFVLLYLGVFASIRLPRSEESRRLLVAASVAILIMFGASMGSAAARDGVQAARNLAMGQETDNVYWEIAGGLRRMGLSDEDSIACLKVTSEPGVTLLTHAKWARLARTRLVAAIYSNGKEPAPLKMQAISAATRAGATVIVAEDVDDSASEWASVVPWKRIGDTPYSAYFVRRN